ncbi:MAG TPA: hypothetical protein ENH13_06960 [Euryarchaeota archaeon]|nr:hypothetical protein BMS3Abin16_01672 [archaeon BMS3Abin16]GBE55923.1 hypothetical protein BMS3Bbin16_00118 [archaeon BMS3Bbin16]HDH28856.1 hypothetical protein [Euryarchaeota archaeon]HDY74642.1 hypothetical protein [Euryarchaeota archaeon]
MTKKEVTPREIRELQIRIIDLETKLANMEKKGARVKPVDLISMSFFATINSAIIVISIVLLLFLRMKLL